MKTFFIIVVLFVGCYASVFKYPAIGDPCIIVQMSANLSLTMSVTGSSSPMKANGVLDGAAISSGSCSEPETRDLSLTLQAGSDLQGTVVLKFKKSTDSKVLMDNEFSFLPSLVFKNNDTMPKIADSEKSMTLSSDTASYTCTGNSDIKFKPVDFSVFKYEFKMVINQVQIQVFNVPKNGSFSPAEDCTNVEVSTQGPTTEPPTTEPPTTQPPTTQSTTKQPLTTQPKNDTTTETTMTTKNVTSEATTIPPTTVTTTEQPTTIVTTVVPTTMTPGPTPKPGSPDTNTYTADTVNTTCLILKAGIEFTVKYVAMGGASKTIVVGIPKGFTVQGNCNGTNTTQSLSVSFYNKLWTLTMIFAESSDQFYMSGVDLNAVLDSSVIKDINNTVPVNINKMFGSDQFSAAKDGSYKCSADTTLTLNDQVSMNTYNLQYAAFQSFPKNTTDFTGNNISECSGDTTTNSVVPIAVGAALAGLVVIVLIAYLIGRRRSRAAGYEQV